MSAVAPITQQAHQPRASLEINNLHQHDQEKNAAVGTNEAARELGDDEKKYDSDGSQNFQEGVNRARAITSVWSVKTMALIFVLLYLVSFVDQMIVSIHYALNPWVSSAFGRHGLIASVGATSSILSGTCSLTIAKVIDIWGRVAGFICMIVLVLVALIMKATAQNFETYMGAYVLYWTGHTGVMYVIDVMLADATSRKNRMLVFAIMGTPLIASTFAGPKVAQLYLDNLSYQWAFGSWAIILAGVAIPPIVILLVMELRAKGQGLIAKEPSGRKWYQSIWFYAIQLDIVGIILITFAFGLIMLPFNLVAYAPNGWATAYIIAMVVTGVVCGALFIGWEKYLAPVQFMPWKYLKDTTLVGSCLVYGIMFLSCFCWNGYFSSYVQVVHRLDVSTAGYVVNSFSLTSAIVSPLFGLLVSWSGNFKYVGYAGVPVMLLGTALIIPFRDPDTSTAVLVITQVLNGLGTGMLSATAQLAVTVCMSHQQVAVALAIFSMFGGIGSSIGFAIAGAMWSNILPQDLLRRLPEESKADYLTIFGDMAAQIAFADGTPERDAVVGAYAHVMRLMVIVGACFIPLVLASVWLWKNLNLKQLDEEEKQTKGNVF